MIGNDQYRTATLATPANDAGLVADALGAAGFAVTGARNFDQAALRETFREFIGQVASAGPNAVAVIYLAGFGLQFGGENYFVPIDADIQRDVDVRCRQFAFRISPQPLAALPGRVKIIVLDARTEKYIRARRPAIGGTASHWSIRGLAWPSHLMSRPGSTERAWSLRRLCDRARVIEGASTPSRGRHYPAPLRPPQRRQAHRSNRPRFCRIPGGAIGSNGPGAGGGAPSQPSSRRRHLLRLTTASGRSGQ